MVNMRPFTAFEQKNLKFLVNHTLLLLYNPPYVTQIIIYDEQRN